MLLVVKIHMTALKDRRSAAMHQPNHVRRDHALDHHAIHNPPCRDQRGVKRRQLSHLAEGESVLPNVTINLAVDFNSTDKF